MSWIPLRTADRLAVKIGRVMSRKLKSRTRVSRKNLQACFPGMPAADIDALVEQNMIEMCKGMLEAPFAWWRDVAPVAANASVIGLDKLLAAQAKGSGVLIMGGHFAAVDMILAIFADRVARDYELGYMYRPHDNPVIDRTIANGRHRHHVRGFTKHQLKDMVQYLKDGGMAWYGCDQNFNKSDLFAPFFGVPAANLSTPSWIVKESGAAVVFMRMHRLPDGNYEYEFSDELPPFGDDPQQDCECWNGELEKAILKYPAQYFWIHKRFKKRPKGMPEFY
ncbi:lysophospholipid acyltransferase family protein [Thalassolituus sp. LLYu03]|uniref:lysophospholipid acyltransferase family protein n=1 Tax=Thalassolituus sp. LLYu03 TaxID=3421656 RepID=UPI003D2B14F2